MNAITGDSQPRPPEGSPIPDSAPWMAEDLLPEKSLGGDTGLWRGKSEPMSLADIEAHLRNQKVDEKAPIHWVEVPGSPRVVHVSEVPELREALAERDLRHARTTLRRDRVVTLLMAAGCVALASFED